MSEYILKFSVLCYHNHSTAVIIKLRRQSGFYHLIFSKVSCPNQIGVNFLRKVSTAKLASHNSIFK
jgi:hypothetical protein